MLLLVTKAKRTKEPSLMLRGPSCQIEKSPNRPPTKNIPGFYNSGIKRDTCPNGFGSGTDKVKKFFTNFYSPQFMQYLIASQVLFWFDQHFQAIV